MRSKPTNEWYKQTSKQTSEWPGSHIPIPGVSEPLWKGRRVRERGSIEGQSEEERRERKFSEE